jgi:prepilin-type N-terminal cleavage/methylation domain-containing protein
MVFPACTTHNQRLAFTLIELLVVVSIIAILASLLIPAISLAQSMAKTTKCGSNLRQIYVATLAYTEDNEGALPPAMLDQSSGPNDLFWFSLIGPYADSAKGSNGSYQNLRQNSIIWGCPSFKKNPTINWNCGYGMNHWLKRPTPTGNPTLTSYKLDATATNLYGTYAVFTLDAIDYPSTRPLFGDSSLWYLATFTPTPARHRGNLSVVYCDGNVGGLTPARLKVLRDDPTK